MTKIQIDVERHGDAWTPAAVGKITGLIVGALTLLTGLILLVGLALQHLWNWLMPELFDTPAIGYWQSVGLLILSQILLRGTPSVNVKRGADEKDEKSEKNEKDGESGAAGDDLVDAVAARVLDRLGEGKRDEDEAAGDAR